jgi:osmotically-inducible protein OsmY
VRVIAKDGAVTLMGIVESYAEKIAAESAVKRVKGVLAIAENLEVKLPEEPRTSDEGIAERIARLLSWTSTLRNTAVLAEVRSGHVTLTGEVDYPYQKQFTAQRVGELDGVTGITNEIRIRPRVPELNARELVRQITRALHRQANVEASNIHVSITDGRVKLEGTIPTYPERDLVEEAVWATRGVTEVEDQLRVG